MKVYNYIYGVVKSLSNNNENTIQKPSIELNIAYIFVDNYNTNTNNFFQGLTDHHFLLPSLTHAITYSCQHLLLPSLTPASTYSCHHILLPSHTPDITYSCHHMYSCHHLLLPSFIHAVTYACQCI